MDPGQQLLLTCTQTVRLRPPVAQWRAVRRALIFCIEEVCILVEDENIGGGGGRVSSGPMVTIAIAGVVGPG